MKIPGRPLLVDTGSNNKAVKWLPQIKKSVAEKGLEYSDHSVNNGKGTGFTRPEPPKWKKWVPLRVRTMVQTNNALFVAIPPDVIPPDDPLSAFKGNKGVKNHFFDKNGF